MRSASRNRCVVTACWFLLFAMPLTATQPGKHPSGSPQDVLTYHGDTLRTGWFSSETQLTVSNVNPQSFGLLQSVVLDGRVDGEPLYVSQLNIPGKGIHNTLMVVTENNSVYAIDADTGAILGHRNFGTPVPYAYKPDCSVFPVVGILGTPVIDRTAAVMYLVTDTYNGTRDFFHLHEISITNGKDVVPPALINFSVKLSNGTTWTFNPEYHVQRPGLLEANGSIYVAFGSTGDHDPTFSRGSILRYDATTLAFLGSDVTNTLFDTTAPFYLTSIWQSGYAPAVDANGDIYFSTANSDPNTPSYSAAFNHPESVVQLSGDLTALLDSFTPYNYFTLDQGDVDLGAGGVLLLPDQPGSIPHIAVAGGKGPTGYLLNRDNLGGYTQGGPDNVLQKFVEGACWCGPAYFMGSDGNPYVVTGGRNGITSWQLQTGPSVKLVKKSTTGPSVVEGLPDNGGSFPVVSSNGTTAGSAIVWFVQRPLTSSRTEPGTPITLYAYDASNLQNQLLSIPAGTWLNAANTNANIVPTVANGKVYVASNEQVQIFGLFTTNAKRAALPPALQPAKPQAVTCGPDEPVLAAAKNAKIPLYQFNGTVCRLEGNELQLALRSGRSISVQLSAAFTGHPPVVLSLGRTIHVQATIDAKGVAHAARISPSHTP